MSTLYALMALMFLWDALRMRTRLQSLAVCPPSRLSRDEALLGRWTDGTWHLLCAPGVRLDRGQLAGLARFAETSNLQVLDLVSVDLPAADALALAQLVAPRTYRSDALAPGRTAGQAVLVHDDVWRRARVHPNASKRAGDFAALAVRLKKYAPTASDLVVVDGMHATASGSRERAVRAQALLGSAAPVVLVVQGILWIALLAGLCLPGLKLWAGVAGCALHAQPLVVACQRSVRVLGAWRLALLRLPVEVAQWWHGMAVIWSGHQGGQRRPPMDYARWFQEGAPTFFAARRQQCPMCNSPELREHLRTRDVIQKKPGEFRLDRCGRCGHIFQNPALSDAGMAYYYADFYDGLGGAGVEAVFGWSARQYLDRARMVVDSAGAVSGQWLDVGAGHGHFCLAARDVCPDVAFDGLDFGESIDEAARRGWVRRGLRGLFRDHVDQIRGTYDVVSMHHYLEHTMQPEQELVNARAALKAGGLLLLELPDPDSLLGKVLGRYWLPWFQPQHQHLMSRATVAGLLHRQGFEVVAWHSAEAHQRIDFLAAVLLWLDGLAPLGQRPWLPTAGWLARAWRRLLWVSASPLVIAARALDCCLDPVVRALGMSNTFRVLARRV